MSRSWRMLIPIAILLALSCGQPETESPETDAAPVAEETAPDPTVVDADHYKIELENERVRLVRITYGPGEESVMHYHPDRVAVFLTAQHVQFEMPDGTSEDAHAEAGEHLFAPAGQHLPRNMGEEPLELLLVELKSGGAASDEETGPDAAVVDVDHYKVEFENDRVRLVRITYEAGAESVMHYHPDSVGIFLSAQHVLHG